MALGNQKHLLFMPENQLFAPTLKGVIDFLAPFRVRGIRRKSINSHY